jgi:hypothetical protein
VKLTSTSSVYELAHCKPIKGLHRLQSLFYHSDLINTLVRVRMILSHDLRTRNIQL